MSGESSGHGAGHQAPRWELLADYASGALDGTPEAERVAARIAADPEWATAHRELLAADARIREELTGLAALTTAESAPAGLFDRLDAALAEPAAELAAEPAVAEVRSLDEVRRRRFRRLSAAAAAVVVLAGVGAVIGLVSTGRPEANTASSSAVNGGNAPASSPSASEPAMGPHIDRATPDQSRKSGLNGAAAGPVRLEATGTDYQPATLPTVLRAVPTSEAVPPQGDATPTLPAGSADRVPADLTRLTGGAALGACLDALDGVFAARPVLVDYARFRGSAALVAVIPTAAADNPWLVVAGPECGTGTADVRYQRHAS